MSDHAGRPPRIESDEVKRRTDLAALIGREIRLIRTGPHRFKGLCPFHADREPSLHVDAAKGVYNCSPCGAGGDCFSWVMARTGAPFRDVLKRLAVEAGLVADGPGQALPRPKPIVVTHDDAAERTRREQGLHDARMVWRQSGPIRHGDPADTYLTVRGLSRDKMPAAASGSSFAPGSGAGWQPSLRLNRACFHSFDRATGQFSEAPALVCAVQDISERGHKGPVVGVQRIYLKPDGSGKAALEPAKKMLGACWHNAVCLTPLDRAEVHIAEGVETALSVLMAFSPESTSGMAVLAALSLGNLGAVRLPAHITDVTLWTDSDETDRDAARALVERACATHVAARRRVQVCAAPEGQDWNDVLRGIGRLPLKGSAA
ncbi:MAG: CHC2 zinc finger domain-containing protein [Rhodospirillaceae bacterium]|nr:CHC2 zinc finger domain-containing protein [Rhodospirillaceae bacterium]